MAGNERISIRQFVILTILFTMGSSVMVAPSLVTAEAKQDAWLSVLVGIACGLLLAKLYGRLAQRHPDMTLAEYSDLVLGKWAGKFVSVSFFLFLLILSAILLRLVGEFITTLIMPETPIQAVEIVFVLTIITGGRLGLETVARTSEMLFPYIIIFFLFMVLFLAPEMRLENFSPILENGIGPVLQGAFRLLGIPFAELAILLAIAPYVANTCHIGKSLMAGTFIGGVILSMITMLCIAVLGADSTARFSYPTYQLAQKINIGNFIQRIEIVSGGILFLSLFVKITLCYYSMVISLAQSLRMLNYRTLTFPLGMLVVGLSQIIFPNVVYQQMIALKAWTPLVLLYGLILPLVLLVADVVKRGWNNRTRKTAGE